jgi:hypothetical protein
MLERLFTSSNRSRNGRFAPGIALLALIVATGGSPRAAATSYTFSQGSEPYVELEGSTQIPITYSTQKASIEIPGEVFRLFNREYRADSSEGMWITGGGNLEINDATTTVIIDGFFMTLDSMGSDSKISYRVDGEPGDRILKVEWKNAGLPDGLPTDFVNFQVWLHQRSGAIEMRYGPSRVEGGNALKNGPWVGAFIAPPTFASAIEKFWLKGDPAAPKLDTIKNLSFPKLSGVPANGTLYRIVPKVAASVESIDRGDDYLRVYPSLAAETIEIEVGSTAGSGAMARISDTAGNIVREIVLERGRTSMNLTGLPSGTYMVVVRDRKMREHVQKIVKR